EARRGDRRGKGPGRVLAGRSPMRPIRRPRFPAIRSRRQLGVTSQEPGTGKASGSGGTRRTERARGRNLFRCPRRRGHLNKFLSNKVRKERLGSLFQNRP